MIETIAAVIKCVEQHVTVLTGGPIQRRCQLSRGMSNKVRAGDERCCTVRNLNVVTALKMTAQKSVIRRHSLHIQREHGNPSNLTQSRCIDYG